MNLSSLLNLIKNNLGLVLIVLALSFGFFYGRKIYRSEVQRMENNYLSAVQELRKENQEQGRAYFLSIDELKREFPEIKRSLSEMDIKLKNVISAQNINTQTVTNINTLVRDTLISDTIPARVASYKDKWTDFSMVEVNNKIQAKIKTTDSLFIALYKVKRNLFEFLRGEPKQVRSEVKNYSPNSTITYNRFISIQK
jgi:hypothetical protein